MTANPANEEYDQAQPLYPGVNAGEILDKVLRHLAPNYPSPNYPGEEETDPLAPSLKHIIVEQINEHPNPPVCAHMQNHLLNMSTDVIHSLPEEERKRLARAIGSPAGERRGNP